MAARTFRLPMLRWIFLPLVPAAAFLGIIATAIVTRDPYLALYIGGPVLLAAVVLFLALRAERFEIDAEGVTIRAPFQRLAILKVPFADIDLSVQTSRWPYKHGYLSMYAIRGRTTEYGDETYLHLLGQVDLRGLSRDDINWIAKHPGLKVEDDSNPEAADANRQALFESKMKPVSNGQVSRETAAASPPDSSPASTRES